MKSAFIKLTGSHRTVARAPKLAKSNAVDAATLSSLVSLHVLTPFHFNFIAGEGLPWSGTRIMFSSFGHHVAKHFSRSKLLLQSTRTRTRTAPARTITSSTNKNNQEKNEENVPPSVGGERARPVRTTYMLERLAPWFGWFLIVWTVWVTYRGICLCTTLHSHLVLHFIDTHPEAFIDALTL